MPKLNEMMSTRSVRKLDVELQDCRENLNTWFVLYTKLFNMKRSLCRKSITQTDRAINLVAKGYIRLHYTNEMVYSDTDEDSDAESNDRHLHKNKQTGKTQVEVESESDSDSIDLEDDTENSTKIDKAKHMNNTEIQNQALNVLSHHEDEQAVLDRHIAERRKELHNTHQQGVKRNVNFTLSVNDAQNVNDAQSVNDTQNVNTIPPRPDNIETEEYEILLEEEVTEDQNNCNERILTDEEVSKLASQCVKGGMIGVPDKLLADVMPSDDPDKQIAGVMPSSVQGVKFITDTGEPPVVNALLKISPNDRENLYTKLYQTAKNNVTRQVGNNQISQDKLNELIRNESSRLLQVYKETH